MEQVAKFSANYRLNFDVELPAAGGGFRIFAHSPATPHGCDGPLIRIESKSGIPWLACFCKGFKSGDVADAAYTTPNPDVACVISNGAGYWVNTLERDATNVPVFPIRQVECTHHLLLFADFTNIAAFGSNGPLWVSDRLVWENLIINTVDENNGRVLCQGWNPLAARDVEVIVDLQTGRAITGRLPNIK